jgi:glucans biosynthesis protein C
MSNKLASGERQYYLDWLRMLAFSLLVPYHVGMYYVSWHWHIKSPVTLTGLEPWMRLFSPWRMDLLFVVSGAATSYMLLRRGANGGLLRERAKRLLLPLLFGVLVIVPPQSYFEVAQRFAYSGGYLEFMQLYLRAYQRFCDPLGRCLILPTWNHLWYLPYLFFYTLILWLLLSWRKRLLDNLASAADKWLGAAWLLILPISFLILTQLGLRPRFPNTYALVDDWFAHSQHWVMFMFGATLARSRWLAIRAEGLRWWALLIALAAWGLLVGDSSVFTSTSFTSTPFASALIRASLFSVQQWCAVLAALGFGYRLLNFDSAVRPYLNDAVFPIYILHQTLIILFAMVSLGWSLNPALQAVLLILATFVFGFGCFEIIRRTPWLRGVFGLKPIGAPATANPR